MENVKYEAVFGDQSLFDSTVDTINEDALIVLAHNSYKVFFQDIEDAFQWIRQDTSHRSKCIDKYAMRRIIRTPTWTKEDQKEGKLPEVGCRVLYARNGLNGEIVSIDDSDDDDVELCLRFKDKSLLVCKMNLVKPIESPEEKAARLRDEWCNEAGLVCSLGMTTLTRIYDALLSGDLPVPVKGE